MKKLARILSISWPEAVGYLHYLWWWALDFAQDGDLSKYESGDIADAVLWQRDPEELMSALIDSGFVDKTRTGGLEIHDWFDYAGKLVEQRTIQREQSRLRQQKRRDRLRESHTDNAEVTRDISEVTKSQYTTVPNSTEPYPTEPDITPPDNKPTKAPVPYEKIRELFNVKCPSLSKVMGINGKRKIAVAARWGEHPDLNFFASYFSSVEKSAFLKGTNDRGWKANFDWLMNPANMDKVREGKYDGGGKKNGANKEHAGDGNFTLSGFKTN